MEVKLREEFLDKVRGQIDHWDKQEIPYESKFDGLAESVLEIIDNEYQLSPVNDDGIVLPSISGKLKKKYLGEDESVDEVRDEFVEHFMDMKNYWREQGMGHSDKNKLSGFMFSTLVVMDGGTPLPPFYLASNKEPDVDLAGFLHEQLYQKK